MSIENSVNDIEDVLESYEVTSFPDELLDSLNTVCYADMEFGYFNGRSISTDDLLVELYEVQNVADYYRANVIYGDSKTEYLVKIPAPDMFKDEILMIERMAFS